MTRLATSVMRTLMRLPLYSALHNDLQAAKFRGVVWPRLPPAFLGTSPSSFELVSRIIARRRLVEV